MGDLACISMASFESELPAMRKGGLGSGSGARRENGVRDVYRKKARSDSSYKVRRDDAVFSLAYEQYQVCFLPN